MRRLIAPVLALSLAAAIPAAAQDEVSRSAAGGIRAPGWMGRVDANEATAGMTVDSASLMPHGAGLHVKTGPAITYWSPANEATGDYTVRATFTEENYMALNSHPHPYGIVIGGNRMGTDQQSYLYCAAYGNGRFIVRGFGPQPFQLNGRGAEHAAVNRAAGPGQPVTQEIAVSVRGSKISCAINGTEVASYDRSDVVGFNRLTSTDGVYGLRFGHNTEAMVTGLTVTRGIRVIK
ncbi:MAG: hypothetical protein H0X64_00665 [Gemmatimonadaceae bacterium]|nr:hypothetical protein [Gemmatimonadaceae bacterium]